MELNREMLINVLKVNGGAVMNDYLMQFQSDILGIEIARAQHLEAIVLGATFLTNQAVGFWENMDELKTLMQLVRNLIFL